MNAFRRPTVLVLEQDGDLRRVLARGLSRSGCTVHASGDAREGLMYLHQSRPDVVVSDLLLPDLDGFELLRVIRGMLLGAGVVLTCGDRPVERESVLRMARTLGATHVIRKPFDYREMLDAVQGALTPTVG